MENKTNKIKCPNCGGDVKLWGNKNSYDLFQCNTCGLVFVSPLPDPTSVYNDIISICTFSSIIIFLKLSSSFFHEQFP